MKALILLVLSCLIVLGCGNSSSKLVGTWTSGMGGAVTTYHFQKDGTFTFQSFYDSLIINVKGTYKLDGDRIVMEPTASDVQGSGPNIDQVRAQATQSTRLPVRWDTPASFTILFPEGPGLMLSRISEVP